MMETDEKRDWSRWHRKQANGIERTASTTAPAAGLPETDPAPDLHIWDTWPLRTRSGEIATVDGWQVLISLTAPADVTPGERHDIAEHRYFVSRDGQEWVDQGPVFGDDALGTRQWAGSALYDDGELYFFYTAAGDPDSDELSYTQRLAVGHGASVETSGDELSIEGPWHHEVLLEPDGEWYETQAQSGEMTYTFRDPWFFEDPETGRTHLLFESNTPADTDDCGGRSDQQAFNGCVGLAVSPSGDPLDWEFRPPIFDSVCVNQEIERPHVVVSEGRYYLLVSSHVDTFAPGLAGYDALYGFVADSLQGEYRPLNGSGLVVTNPATAPFQAYSWLAIGHGEELLVSGFLNYPGFDGERLEEIASLSGEEQRQRFAGTLTPTLRLAVEGEETRIHGDLDHWAFPSGDETLPPVSDDWSLPAEALEREPGITQTERRRAEGPFW
ncbi:MAG: glycoside hydrolase family 68 protein [Halohasta sp.]